MAALVLLLAGPAAAAAAVLGITLESVTALKVLLEDMPDDVATQMCNTFAKDRADETDAPLWEEPGEGVAVAPDDIKAFWDAPDASTSSPGVWRGLYGHTEALLLTPWRMEAGRVHRVARSTGPAYVTGRVRYRGDPVEGAHVRFGCESTMTTTRGRREPGYAIAVAAGHYEVAASAYWPATKRQLTGRRVVLLTPGGPVRPGRHRS